MPPISCTSKWRSPSTRRLTSRTTANASGSKSSSVSPLPNRSLNSAVLRGKASSGRSRQADSSALMRATPSPNCLRSRSFLEGKNLLRKPGTMCESFAAGGPSGPSGEEFPIGETFPDHPGAWATPSPIHLFRPIWGNWSTLPNGRETHFRGPVGGPLGALRPSR